MEMAAPEMPTEPLPPLEGPVLPGATDEVATDRAAYPGRLEEYGRQMTEVFPAQQAQYEENQAARAEFDRRAANPTITYSGGGQSFTVDPMEARRAQQEANQRRADLLRQAFSSVPEMQQYIGPASAMVQAGEDIKPSDVFGMAKTDAAARAKAAEDAARQQENLRTHPDVATQDRWHREAAAAAAERARAAGESKPPTEAQSKAAIYGRAIEDAVGAVGDAAVLTPEILEKYQRNQLGAEAADTSAAKSWIGGKVVGAGRSMGLVERSKFDGIPPEAQQVLNQVEVAKESLARIHSGGAIPTAEDRAFADLWAPKAGDSPALIAQKLRQMDTEAKRLLALSGNAAPLTTGITNKPPAKAPVQSSGPPPGAVIGTMNGKRVWATPDGRHGEL
jgi:hypothetical protein